MKIIKRGNGQKARKLSGTCKNCGTKVECEQHEAMWVEDRPGDGAHAVTCPVCKHSYLWVK